MDNSKFFSIQLKTMSLPDFYILDCDIPEASNGAATMEIHNAFRVGNIRLWSSGIRHEKEVPVPIEIEYETFHGYEGPPIDLLDVGIPIMSEKLAEALLSFGVKNIDFYDAILTHKVTRATYKFKAFNVIGLVAAADMNKSNWASYDGDPTINVSFKKLVLKPTSGTEPLIFRLAENIKALMIRSDLRDHLVKSGFGHLKYKNPKDWIQL